MASTNASRSRVRSGFSLLELVIVLMMISVVAAMAIPRLNLSKYRSDAAAQQVRSVFQTAQRTSLTRQYDVIVSVDTIKNGLRIAEDVNNDGSIQTSEWKFWRPLGEGNTFLVPPKGLTTPVVSASVVGATLKTVDGMPSVVFHRDGSSNSGAEIYVGAVYKGRTDYRLVTLDRATGRAELYRLVGSGATATWTVVQ